MPQITIASERLLELCDKALEEVKRQQASAPDGFPRAMTYQMPAFSLDAAHSIVHNLAGVARRAQKIGGQGQTQVVVNDQELSALEWLQAI